MTSHITASDQLPCRFPVVLPLGLSHFCLLPADISSGFSVPSFCLSINHLSSTSHLSITFLSIFTHYLSINHLPVNLYLSCVTQSCVCQSIIYLSINLYLYPFVNHIPVNQSCICQSICIYHLSIILYRPVSHISVLCVYWSIIYLLVTAFLYQLSASPSISVIGYPSMTLPSVTHLLISAPSSLHQSINQETNTDHPLLYLQITCPRLYIKAVVTPTIPYLCLCFSSQWLETPHQAGY